MATTLPVPHLHHFDGAAAWWRRMVARDPGRRPVGAGPWAPASTQCTSWVAAVP
ncbi:MAG: hypothetical protein ACYCX8_06580 [Acidimicrobiales bacterium]